MLIKFSLMLCFAMFAEIILQNLWISKMQTLKVEQVTKLYGPSWHEKTKMGTPTMGGVVFPIVTLLSLFLLYIAEEQLQTARIFTIVSYPFMAAFVGLLDDFLKYKRRSSDGLRSMQKLFLQIAVTLLWVMCFMPDNYELISGIPIPNAVFVAIVVFIGVGFQNAVNVTDGLDGLAAGCTLISFLGALAFLFPDPLTALMIASACGICLGFLWHNANPARVFMGDVGAHFFAGLLFSICLESGALLMIIPLGFMFGMEIISVALQIFTLRMFKKECF